MNQPSRPQGIKIPGFERLGNVARNLISLLTSSVASRALAFVTLVILARRLGVEGYGLLIFTQVTVNYFLLGAQFGLPTFGIRELARERDRAARWAGSLLSLRLLTTLAASILLALFVLLIPRSQLERSLLLLYGLILPVSIFTLDWVFQAVEQMQYITIARIAQSAVYLLLVALFVQNDNDAVLVPVMFSLGIVTLNLVLGWVFIRQYGWPRISWDRRHMWLMLKQSAVFGLSMLMIEVYYNADRIILRYARTEAEVGWYDAAYRFVLLFTGIAALIAQSILPGMSVMWKETDLSQVKNVIRLVAKFMIYLSMPVAAGSMLLAAPIIDLIYGAEYAPSVGVLQIIVWQIFTVYANVAFAQALLAFNQQKLYFYSAAVGALANLTLNIFLIPRYGMLGASISTVVAEVLVLGSLYVFAARAIVTVSVIEPLVKAGLACAGMALVIWLLPEYLWLQIPLGALTYGIVLIATIPFTADERQQLRRGKLS